MIGKNETFEKTWYFKAGLHDIYQHENPLGMSKQDCGIYINNYSLIYGTYSTVVWDWLDIDKYRPEANPPWEAVLQQ